VASIIAGTDVTVMVSYRIERVSIVAYERWTIILDGSRAGLLDLCVAARLLRWRRKVKETFERKNKLSQAATRALIQRATDSLVDQYPGILQLHGCFRNNQRKTWPDLVWRKVRWKPLDEISFGQACHTSNWQYSSTIEVTGADDLPKFFSAVESGQIEPEYFCELPGIPVVTVSYSITAPGEPSPQFEHFENEIRSNRTLIRDLQSCYTRKAESALPERLRGRQTTAGVVLDMQRLVEAEIGRRSGLPPRVFKRRAQESQPLFDPKRHLVVCAFNANSLQDNEWSGRTFSYHALGIFLEGFKLLGVNLVVVAFSDHLVTLKNGKRVYAQLLTQLKGVNDAMDATFYNRFTHVLQAPPRLAGIPCCFPPFMIRRVQDEFARAHRTQDHDYRTVLLIARGNLPGNPFNTEAFLRRAADAMDARLRVIQEKFPGIFDPMFSFIPEPLKLAGKPGGFVSKMY
jgi:hypothetical protein